MSKITFYTTHCPKCKVLEMKLKQKNVEYSESDDIEEMKSLGVQFAPFLKVDDKILDFTEAVSYINNLQ